MNMIVKGFPADELGYPNKTFDQKQWYWDGLISQYARTNYDNFPKPLSDFRDENKHLEENMNPFLIWILKANRFYFNTLEDIFILDENAKEYIYEKAPELLEACKSDDIQQYLHERKNEIHDILPKEENTGWGNIKQVFWKILKHFRK